MRYLLVVGFYCNVYKRKPRARIFLNDQFIDEFIISHHKDTLTDAKINFQLDTHLLQPIVKNIDYNIVIQNFPSLRFYEIEIDQKQDQLKLCVDIDNNDNNYNNGFMSKNTLLNLRFLYFFPFNEKLLSRLHKIQTKNRTGKNHKWIRSDKNIIFELCKNGLKWQSENKKIFNFLPNAGKYTIGGNGHFTCDLIKKYGIFITKIIKSFRYDFSFYIIYYLYTKYTTYANQRNNN